MKKLPLITLTLCASMLFFNQCTESNSPEPIQINDSIVQQVPFDLKKCTQLVVSSNNEFGIDLFKRMIENSKENATKNIFISPTSISIALAMVYNGADGNTKTAMETTLKKQGLSIGEINQTYKNLIQSLTNNDEKLILQFANSIFHNQDFTFNQNFIDSNKVNYLAEVTPLDYSDITSVDIINNWVAQKTNNKISSIINKISPNDIMTLVNAVYFKGAWEKEFNKDQTLQMAFTTTNNTVNVETMNLKYDFPYFENEQLQMLEMPYKNGNYSMIVILPKSNNSINSIISDLTVDKWSSWISGLQQNEVDVYFPKLKFAYGTSLNSYLSNMGMADAFIPGIANFSKINNAGNLYISEVTHKTTIEINEEGTEATAVTGITMGFTAAMPHETISFIVNKPYMVAIRDKQTNSIVFVGRVVNPLAE